MCCCYPALPFKFVDGLKDVDALTTQDVTLACTVSKDDVQLTWKKNGKEIKPDGKKYEVVCDGTVHRLVIHDLQLDDDAEYQCCFGDELSSCKLHVEGTNNLLFIFRHLIRYPHLLLSSAAWKLTAGLAESNGRLSVGL